MARKNSRSALTVGRPAARKPEATTDPAGPESPAGASSLLPFCVVGIGASAGGIEAVSRLFRALPADTGLAFVLIQHLDPSHPSMLTEIMSRMTMMPVSEVTRSVAVDPGRVYVIPPGSDLVMADGELLVTARTETRGQHRSIDRFLRSLAEDQGHKAIGIILSGSATDGTLGLEEIKAAGGITIAQDESAQHESMPRSAIAAGCVDFVLPPEQIAEELVRISRHPYVAPGAHEHDELLTPKFEIVPVLDRLHRSHGVDFSHYKHNTLFRRIARRMLLHKMEGLDDYLRLLEKNPGEVDALYQDILISVTSFFRNPETYEALKQEVFPQLLKDRARQETLRLWVLGCSTGEEAYSLAIALSEFMDSAGRQLPIQIFATDLNGAGVEKARSGIYSRNIAQDMTPERLRRYFVESNGGYRVRKSIRDVCVFARHNVLTEPPFSRLDVVSCRNLLIYLGQEVQQRVIPTLHYALQPRGFLWLGNSETIGSFRDLFEPETAKHRIYRKKAQSGRYNLGAVVQGLRREPVGLRPNAVARETAAPSALEMQKEADRILLAKYAPASVVVNGDHEILQFRGNTGLFLTPAPGRASLNLLKMVREGLLVSVRGALHKAGNDGKPVRKEGLRVKTNGGYQEVSIEVIPVRGDGSGANCFLILFEPFVHEERARGGRRAVKATAAESDSAEREANRVKQELASTREYLQSVIEQQEAANEELQSANEEVQSANEELQSINEELETSKEEIQSSNEELATVNEELNHRNVELSESNNDFLNLLASVQIAIVIVGSNLRIRRFTPAAERILNLIPADVGRPIRDLTLNTLIPDFERQLEEVIDTVSAKEFEVKDRGGKSHSLRLRPYRTLDNRIEGAVIVLVDIDGIKRSDETLRRQGELLEHAHDPVIMWEVDGVITYWNPAAERVFGYAREAALDRRAQELLATTPAWREIESALLKEGQWSGRLTQTRQDGQRVTVNSRMSLVRKADGRNFVIDTSRPVADGET